MALRAKALAQSGAGGRIRRRPVFACPCSGGTSCSSFFDVSFSTSSSSSFCFFRPPFARSLSSASSCYASSSPVTRTRVSSLSSSSSSFSSTSLCSFSSMASLSSGKKKVSLLSSFNATRVVVQGTRHQNLAEHFVYHRSFRKSLPPSSSRLPSRHLPPPPPPSPPSLSSSPLSFVGAKSVLKKATTFEESRRENEKEKKKKKKDGSSAPPFLSTEHLPRVSSSSSSSSSSASSVEMSAYNRLRHSLFVFFLKRRTTSAVGRLVYSFLYLSQTPSFSSLRRQGERDLQTPAILSTGDLYVRNLLETNTHRTAHGNGRGRGEVSFSIRDLREFGKQTEERKNHLLLFSSVFLAIGASIVGLISIVIHWYEEPLIQIKENPDKQKKARSIAA